MRIDRVTLKNIKSFKELSVEFFGGVNFICGLNGAGKTTLVEAIGLALFDASPVKELKRYFIRTGEKSGEIAVEFTTAEGASFRVVRKLGGADSRRVYEGGVELDLHGSKDVDAFMREQLGLEQSENLAALFDNVLGVRQGFFTQPFLMPPLDRKRQFNAILKLDQYAKAAEAGKQPIALINGKREQLVGRIQTLEAETERAGEVNAQLAKAKETLARLTTERAALQTANDEAQKQLAALKTQKQALDEAEALAAQSAAKAAAAKQTQEALAERYTQAQAAQERIAALRADYDSYVTAKAGFEELEQARAERDEAQNALNLVKEKISALSQRISAARTEATERLAELDAQKRELEGEALSLPARLAALGLAELKARRGEAARLLGEDGVPEDEELITLSAQLERATAAKTQSDAQCARLSALVEAQRTALEHAKEGNCPLFGGRCPNTALIATTAAALEDLQNRLAEAQSNAAHLNEEIRAHEEKTACRREMLKAQLTRLDDDIKRGEGGAVEIAEREKSINASLERIARANEAEQNKLKTLEALGAEQAALEKEQAGLTGALAQHAGLNEKLRAAKERMSTLEAARLEYERNIKSAEEAPELERKLASARDAAKRESVKAQEASAAADRLRTAFAPGALEEAEVAARESYGRLSAKAAELEGANGQLSLIEKEAQRLSELGHALDQSRGEAERLLATASFLKKALDAIKNAGERMGEMLRSRLSEKAAELYYAITGERTSLVWTQTYELQLGEAGSERTFKQLSGGEQMAAALALRLGLLTLAPIGIAFFDEPTANLDATRRSGLCDMLSRVRHEYEQLFIISHDDTFDSITENVILLQSNASVPKLSV